MSSEAELAEKPVEEVRAEFERVIDSLIERGVELSQITEAILDKIPSWIPIVRPYLESMKRMSLDTALGWQGVDWKTGEKTTEGLLGKLKLVAQTEGGALMSQFKAATDVLLLLGTGGESVAVEAGAEAAAKTGTAKLLEIITEVAQGKTSEMLLRELPELLQEGAGAVSNEQVAKLLQQTQSVLADLIDNEFTRGILTKTIQDSKIVQELEALVKEANLDPQKLAELIQQVTTKAESMVEVEQTEEQKAVGSS